MCGLFGGASSSLNDKELERIAQLAIISQLRGTDSTGVLSCFRQSSKIAFKIIKDVGDSSQFIYGDDFTNHVKTVRPFVIAGHCRDATVGDVTYENAHPYNVGKIVGMKNGTVPNVPGKKADETDSRALLRLLQDEGLEAAAKAADRGGCAMVWADTRDLSLNFYRNLGRPLWVMEAGGVVYWASEYEMLSLVRYRTGIAYNSCVIEALPAETHRKYSLVHMLRDPVDKKILVREPVSYNLGQDVKKVVKEETVLVPLPKAEPSVPITVHKEPAPTSTTISAEKVNVPFRIVGYKGLTMKPKVASDILSRGCAHCASKILLKDVDTIKMFSKKEWLCQKCSGDPFALMQAGAHNKELFDCKIIMGPTNGNC